MPNTTHEYSYYYDADDMHNPYGDAYFQKEIDCNYVIPPPQVFASMTMFHVPPPKNEVDNKYTYTLKNGHVLELDHPLPDGIPIEMLMPNRQTNAHQDTQRQRNSELIVEDEETVKHILVYASIILCPLSGFLFYRHYMKKDKKFAKHDEKFTFTTFAVLGSLLFCLL